jgi:hypothetical protein
MHFKVLNDKILNKKSSQNIQTFLKTPNTLYNVDETNPQRSICSNATISTPRFFVWQVAWMLLS